MRHLGSIVLSLLIGPAIYALSGIGLVRMAQFERVQSTRDIVAVSTGLAALLVAGLLYAPLVMSRLSPLGPVLVGLGFLGLTWWAVFARRSFVDTVPVNALGVSRASWVPAGTVTTLLAVPLLATIFSPRRWRRWSDRPAAVDGGYAGYPPGTDYPTPPYPSVPAYSAPAYPPVPGEPTWTLPPSGPPAWPVQEDPGSTRRLG